MKPKTILIILTLTLLLTSCSKDKGCGNGTIEYANIPQSDKDLIPYKGSETLFFLHVNTGDTLKFSGEPDWTSYSNSTFRGADCPIEVKREGRGIAFINNQSKNMVFNQYVGATTTTYFEISFDNLNIFTRLLFSNQKFLDSITIQGKKYFDIYFYSNDNTSPKPTDYGCYYTRNDGIIKLYTSAGESWELISKH
jgi:hypothetical protein